jgi:hypothetical protein
MLAPDKKKFLLQRALERAHWDWNDMVQAARAGAVQILDAPNGVAVTSISVSGPWKICHVMAMAGNADGYLELSDIVDRFAYDMGCQIIRAEGRDGFSRAKRAKPILGTGWKPVGIVYEKMIGAPPECPAPPHPPQ